MIKKLLFLLLFFGFVTSSLQASPVPSRTKIRLLKQHPKMRRLYEKPISYWRQRAQHSFQRALAEQKRLPADRRLPMGNPAFAVNSKLPPRESLPALPDEIFSQQDIIDYYLDQLNEQYVQETEYMQQTVFPQLDARLQHLQYQALHFRQPINPIAYIVRQIPEHVNTLVISLFHSESFIDELNYLWQQVNARWPNRKKFILAEPLPRNFEWTALSSAFSEDGIYPHRPIPYELQELYNQILDEAARQQIRVIGLESPDIRDDFRILTLTPEELEEQTTFRASLAGVNARNESWKEVQEDILKEEEDSPIIIYLVGAMHGFYNRRNSLTQGLDPEKTFVIAFYPTVYQQRLFNMEDNSIMYVEKRVKDPLETLTNGTSSLQQDVLYFPNKRDAQVVGCDAWYRKGPSTDL